MNIHQDTNKTLVSTKQTSIEIDKQGIARVCFVEENSFTLIPGLLGFLSLNSGLFLVSIKESFQVGSLSNCSIYQVTSLNLTQIYFNPTTIQAKLDDDKYLVLFHSHVNSNNLYYSYSFDLSWNRQRAPSVFSPSNSNSKFVWNYNLLLPLSSQSNPNNNFDSLLLPVICGCILII